MTDPFCSPPSPKLETFFFSRRSSAQSMDLLVHNFAARKSPKYTGDSSLNPALPLRMPTQSTATGQKQQQLTTPNKRRPSPSPSPPFPSLPLQEAGSLLSRASSIDTSDTESPYNAACAFALCGDAASSFQALTEFCRRLTATVAAPDVSSRKREEARWSLREASGDVDLQGLGGADWFVSLLNSTDAALAGRA